MSESVESILSDIRQRNGIFPSNGCYVCGARISSFRAKNPDMRFCSDLCNQTEYAATYLFPLGMKRSFSTSIGTDIVFGLRDLPSELQASIILMIFHYSITDRDDWRKLMRLKHSVDKWNRTLIDEQVIPQIRYTSDRVLDPLSDREILNFGGIERLFISEIGLSENRDWSALIKQMSKLVDLEFSSETNSNIDLSQLVKLTRLVTPQSTQNNEIITLVNLRVLVLRSPHVNDSGLLVMTNLTRLEILGSKFYGNSLGISREGVESIRTLRKLAVRQIDSIADNYIGVTQLKSLTLESVKRVPNIETLVNLTSLSIRYMDPTGILDNSLSKLLHLRKLKMRRTFPYINLQYLTNLTDLHLRNIDYSGKKAEVVFHPLENLEKLRLNGTDNVFDSDIVFLTGLKSLTLAFNDFITDKGITRMTNLTYLDLARNEKITRNALRHLKSLRRLQEHNRTYYVENGVISLF